MIDFGKTVCLKRKARGLSQLMLANRVGMTAVQLCKIEKGRSSPTLDTVERIVEALEIPLADIFSPAPAEVDRLPAAGDSYAGSASISRFVSIRSSGENGKEDIKCLKAVASSENKILEFHKKLNIPFATMIPLVHSFKVDASGAKMVACYMRAACAVGESPFYSLAEVLEFRNVRIHLYNFSSKVQSRSFFDTDNHSLSIVLSKSDTPERHVYRIAYELAWAVLFGANGFKPVRDTPLRHRFAREFAAEFLMPEDAVRFTVSQLGIRPEDWSLETVVWLKTRFAVSAEAFALRLESLGLISEHLRHHIRDELRENYKNNPRAMEPKPALAPLKIGMRFKLLKIAAAKRGVEE